MLPRRLTDVLDDLGAVQLQVEEHEQEGDDVGDRARLDEGPAAFLHVVQVLCARKVVVSRVRTGSGLYGGI